MDTGSSPNRTPKCNEERREASKATSGTSEARCDSLYSGRLRSYVALEQASGYFYSPDQRWAKFKLDSNPSDMGWIEPACLDLLVWV